MSEGHSPATTPSAADRAGYWQPYIDAWRASGLSAKRFCTQHSLPYGQFRYWSRKQCDAVGSKPTSRGFARVVPVVSPERGGLTIRLPGGIQIGGIDTDNVALLPQILAQL